MTGKFTVSIILPMHNEASGIASLICEIARTFNNTGYCGIEIIVVDDASVDGSAKKAEAAAADFLRQKNLYGNIADIRIIRLPSRRGQSAALTEGFSAARGELIVSMDADGQYDPTNIPAFIKAAERFDMVCGVRRFRKDGFARKVCSVVANRVRNIMTGDSITDAGCTFRIMRRDCLDHILAFDNKLYGCEFFFHPLILRRKGFSIGQIPVTHRSRTSGKSKYRLIRGRAVRGIKACFKAAWLLRKKCKWIY